MEYASDKEGGLKKFESLESSVKKEILLRALKILTDIKSYTSNKEITRRLGGPKSPINDMISDFLPKRPDETNYILKMLYDLEKKDEQAQSAIKWIQEVMRMHEIELSTEFTQMETIMYWAPYMQRAGIIQLHDDGEAIDEEPSEVANGIIWNLARARAYAIYGISLGFDLNRDAMNMQLSSYIPISKSLDLKITNEIEDLLELMLFRMSMDDGEGPKIEWLARITGISEKAVSNASISGKDLIPSEEKSRKAFTAESSESWLMSRKKNKYDFLPSIREKGDHHWDGHHVIPVYNSNELLEFFRKYENLI